MNTKHIFLYIELTHKHLLVQTTHVRFNVTKTEAVIIHVVGLGALLPLPVLTIYSVLVIIVLNIRSVPVIIVSINHVLTMYSVPVIIVLTKHSVPIIIVSAYIVYFVLYFAT